LGTTFTLGAARANEIVVGSYPLTVGVDDFGLANAHSGGVNIFAAHVPGMIGHCRPLGLDCAAHTHAGAHLVLVGHLYAQVNAIG
jgi:hypothetical protein